MTATWIRSHISPFLFVINLRLQQTCFRQKITRGKRAEHKNNLMQYIWNCERAVRVGLEHFYFISIVIKTLGSALNMEVGSGNRKHTYIFVWPNDKKNPCPYVKWFPRGGSRGVVEGAYIMLIIWAGWYSWISEIFWWLILGYPFPPPNTKNWDSGSLKIFSGP